MKIPISYQPVSDLICIRTLDEVLRRFTCLRFPKAEHEVAQKLNELYVYSDIGNLLGSDAITHAVMKSLKIIENDIPPPEKNKGILE